MKSLSNVLTEWAKMKFTENPYGKPIPKKFLYDERLLRNNGAHHNCDKPLCLAHLYQDGYITGRIIKADRDAPWEKFETISFSAIFHRLQETNTLCPSNYIVAVIDGLKEWDIQHKTEHDEEFFRGTIARSLRCFASYIREWDLLENVERVLSVLQKANGKRYLLYGASVEEDMKYKTDVLLIYDRNTYRIWSYQTTQNGIEKTSNRILGANGRGYNLLFPVNFDEARLVGGWYLYDPKWILHHFLDLVVNRRSPAMSHWEYCQKVREDKKIIKKPCIFEVS